MGPISRRTVLATLAGATAMASRAFAQPQRALPRLALVDPDVPLETLVVVGQRQVPAADLQGPIAPGWRLFFEELRRLGLVEGETIIIQRWSAIGITDEAGRAEIIASILASDGRPFRVVSADRGP